MTENEIAYARKLIEDAFWDVLYYQGALERDHKQLALVEAVLERAKFHPDPALARKLFEDDEEAEEVDTSEQFLMHTYGGALYGVARQERELRDAHSMLATVKALFIKTGLEGEISFDEAEAAALKRYNK